MYINCFLCGEPIPLSKTRRGVPYFACHKCKFRGFANSEEAAEALAALAVENGSEGESGSRTEKKPSPTSGPETPPSPHQANPNADFIIELKRVRKRLDVLEEKNQKPKKTLRLRVIKPGQK